MSVAKKHDIDLSKLPATPLETVQPNWRKALGLQEMGVYYALVLLIATLAVATAYIGQDNYLSIQNLSNVIYQSALIGMMAVAMTVVLISGNFDLSVASVAAFSAVVLVGNEIGMGVIPMGAEVRADGSISARVTW